MDPRDRIIAGLVFTLAYDWNVHRINRKRIKAIAEERSAVIDQFNELVRQHNNLIDTLEQRNEQVEYLIGMLEKHQIQWDEFDLIALNFIRFE